LQDGRAGMVAFSTSWHGSESEHVQYSEKDYDWAALAKHVNTNLPAYARPLFARVLMTTMEVTGTFKQRKVNLVEDGFDPNRVTDPIYFLDGTTYVRLTKQLHASILKGEVRL